MYDLEGKLTKSVGSEGNGELQFKYPRGLDVSDKTNNIYVCDCYNHRVKILTELKCNSMLGIGLLNYPRDVSVTRDRVLMPSYSDPCIFVFNSDHFLINKLISSRGDGRQTNYPYCFFIDRVYNIIMSDYRNHCVYVFSQEGEQIHTFGKEGQGVGEFYRPYGMALDNTRRIIVVCEKNTNRL